jgi:hypothetical protein
MNKKYNYFIVILLALFYANASAQNSQVLYNMKIPQNHFMNPAIKPSNLFYIGLPVLSGVNTGFNNNFLELSDLIPLGDTLSTWPPPDFDLDQLAGNLKENNTFFADANIQLLGIGFMVGPDLNIFIDVNDRIEAKLSFPKDILKLFITGTDQLMNQAIDISGLNLRAQFFREFGIGFSKNVVGKLRVGAKAKLLFGIGSLNFDNRSMTLKVNNDFSQTITADASLDISGQTALTNLKNNFSGGASAMSIVKDYVTTPLSNPGFGMDIGAVYDFNKMFSVSAAIIDLGFIKWKDDLKSYDAQNTFTLNGFSLSDVVSQKISIDSLVQGIMDTVQNSFIENGNPPSYTTYLPTILNAGANINVAKVLSFGILSSTRFYSGQVNEALTLSANGHFGNVFSLNLGYTIANYSYNNFGFGMSLKAGPVQLYFIADKIPVSWSKIYVGNENDGYNRIPLPQSWNMANVQIGLNISFGKIINKKVDKPMVVVE